MNKIKSNSNESSSFRDPSGFLFYRDGLIHRQINIIYKENYYHLMNSGLYGTLVDANLLIPHNEVDIESPEPNKAYKIIKPESIPFISYPYEWCFSQLKDAALTTFKIQKIAMDFEMTLKDCSAYNIQFRKCKPIFIDTLSFEKYHEGQSWIAYRQACQHFLAPLALMVYRDIRLNQLLQIYMDGVPLDLASSLLPSSTNFKASILSHIHLHAKSQKYFANKTVNIGSHKISRLSFMGLIDSLESAIKKMDWKAKSTEWADYYEDNNYSAAAINHKKEIVADFLDKINPGIVWDVGANDGLFSRIASNKKIMTISFDIDPAAVQKSYLQSIKNNEEYILPLLVDLTNPSSGIGWENTERISLLQRGPAEAAFALALIHHLAISNNLPISKIANFFSLICDSLIIEFVPKDDSQVQRLLSTREDIFPDYTQQAFENEFSKYFIINSTIKIKDSKRTMYLMKKRKS
ncbi:MAG: SAM-dependent methyltransferase [Actinobacteria bacterium]|nr:SAM-dependent methyltransferase [Actinomycetota bacterium]MBL7123613.1 SAM-dependent methyltransferase [Actinomycetota bacterium]